jgi:hypothetical protein
MQAGDCNLVLMHIRIANASSKSTTRRRRSGQFWPYRADARARWCDGEGAVGFVPGRFAWASSKSPSAGAAVTPNTIRRIYSFSPSPMAATAAASHRLTTGGTSRRWKRPNRSPAPRVLPRTSAPSPAESEAGGTDGTSTFRPSKGESQQSQKNRKPIPVSAPFRPRKQVLKVSQPQYRKPGTQGHSGNRGSLYIWGEPPTVCLDGARRPRCRARVAKTCAEGSRRPRR